MVQIEKGAPRGGTGPERSELGVLVQELVEKAHGDRGVWYSIEAPPGTNTGKIHSLINGIVARLASERSTKKGRIWVRFYKDSDAAE